MPRITITKAQAALDNLTNSLSSGNTQVRIANAGAALDAMSSVASAVRDVYDCFQITVTDATEADLTAFFAGELRAAVGETVQVGDLFQVLGTGDTTDNALAAAKLADVDQAITVTDLTDATITAFLAATGQPAVAKGGVALKAGWRFRVNGTGDTTDNALQTAKGSAPAANDVFEVNAAGTGVTFIITATPIVDDIFEVTNVGTPAVIFLRNGTIDTSGVTLARGA